MKQIKVDKTIHYEGGIPAAECFEKQKSEAVEIMVRVVIALFEATDRE